MKRSSSSYWQTSSPFIFVLKISVVAIIGFLLSSCAVYYRDRDSGAQHIWGFGHLSQNVPLPIEEKQAIIQRTTLTGVAVGFDNGSFGISVGWDQREHILVYNENVALTIKRPPSDDYFYFKIGTYPIDLTSFLDTKTSPEKKENQQ